MKEKTHLLAKANSRIEITIERLHKGVDEGDYASAEKLNNVLAGLFAEEQALSKISAWPWKPETLRGFLSAVMLPILLWLITTLLGRVLPG